MYKITARKIKNNKNYKKQLKKMDSLGCFNCKREIIDKKYLDYYGGICQKCGYDFYTGWIF